MSASVIDSNACWMASFTGSHRPAHRAEALAFALHCGAFDAGGQRDRRNARGRRRACSCRSRPRLTLDLTGFGVLV